MQDTISDELRKRADQIGMILTDPLRPHPDADLMVRAADTIDQLVNDIRAAAESRQPFEIGTRTTAEMAPGDLMIEATSNTSVTIKLRESDGTVRSAVLTLS